MDPGSRRLLPSEDDLSEASPTHQARDQSKHTTCDTDQQQQQGGTDSGPNESRSSADRIKFTRVGAGHTSDDAPTSYGAVGTNRKKGSVLRKSSLRFKTVSETSAPQERVTRRQSQTNSTTQAVGELAMSRQDSSGSFSTQDRHSRRRKRKPSIMSITISQCSDPGHARQFTQFEETAPQSPRKKRDSVSSATSVKGSLLKPSMMAQGEMFSQCQRQKQWFMAIHASHPDEALPVLRKPVLFVDEGGNLTMEAVKRIFQFSH